MGEVLDYFQFLDRFIESLETLYQTKIRAFMTMEAVPKETRVRIATSFVDLKCDAIISRTTSRVLERVPLEVLKREFRGIESTIREACSFYPDHERTISGKDRASGEREEAYA